MRCLSAWCCVCRSCFLPCSRRHPNNQPVLLPHTISMCTHILWPRLKFMKSPLWSRGGFAAGPSQERNELIVTLRLLLSISELSTAVDRRRPGCRPSVTGRCHQETKQTAGSQKTQPGVTAGGAKHQGDGGGGLNNKKKQQQQHTNVSHVRAFDALVLV